MIDVMSSIGTPPEAVCGTSDCRTGGRAKITIEPSTGPQTVPIPPTMIAATYCTDSSRLHWSGVTNDKNEGYSAPLIPARNDEIANALTFVRARLTPMTDAAI